MTSDKLKIEISIELEAIAETLQEIASLRSDVEGREPTVREKPLLLLSWHNSTTGLKIFLNA